MASNLLILFPKPTTPKIPHPFPIPAISSSLSPPSSKEEAISQARFCLSHSLQKPLKLKKQRQSRFRLEIPIADDTSSSSLTSLVADLFSSLPITNLLLLWPSSDLLDAGRHAFNSSNSTFHSEIDSASDELLNSADLVAFLAPEASMLEDVRVITNSLSPKPAVLFNPRWGYEEEKGFDGRMGRFVGSFDVVYCFMGLEVRGVLSRRKGVVFKYGRDDGWLVMVEDEGKKKKGELQVVSRFEKRPEIGEVESVLYNLMAANSPVTKSVKFFRDLASRISEKKKE